MPKLGPNENVKLKRQQLKEAKELGSFFVSSKLDKWTDEEVNDFYNSDVTKEMFAAYERDKAYRKYFDESDRISEANYQKNKPTKENTGYNDRVRAIQFDNSLSAAERNAKIAVELEHYEHIRIGYEIRHSKYVSDEEKDLYEKLDNKFGLEEYDEKGRQIEEYREMELKLRDAVYNCPVKSLSRWDKIVNGVRTFFGRPESEKVTQFNIYESLKAQKAECEAAIKSATLRKDVLEGNYADALEQREKDRAEEKRLQKLDNLAKDVVRITKGIEASIGGKDAPEPDETEISRQAEILKGKQYFKDAIAELDAENSTVEPGSIVHKLADKIVSEKAEQQKYMDEAMGMENLNIDAEKMENLNINAEQEKKPVVNNGNGLTM